ncbi:MAG: Hsp20/alpha crystallin family protein [Verrucomicrobiaceae bacterium]|jgi:HSP20 family protein|nr:Hsp20/alpha crystallin family protein [Verrucomicrobiaceae bacterium]
MNSLTQWNPFRDFTEWENRLSRALGIGARAGNGKESISVAQWSPAVDISEDDKEFLVKAELPELKKEEIKVSVENGELSITGERKFEKEEKEKKYHRIERSYGSFMRSFTLPDNVSADKVSAEFKDGLLLVHLPKTEVVKPKSVQVAVS